MRGSIRIDQRKYSAEAENRVFTSVRFSRIFIFASFIFVFGIALLYRLVDLQVLNSSQWTSLATKQHKVSEEIKGARGRIYDRAGRSLAVSIERASLAARPRYVKNPSLTAKILTEKLGVEEEKIYKLLSSKRKFVWLMRDLDIKQVNKRLNNSWIVEHGLELLKESRRYYPQADLASPVIGRTRRDGRGQAGVEFVREDNLAAGTEEYEMKRDAKGRRLFTLVSNSDLSLKDTLIEKFKLKYSPLELEPTRSEGSDVSITLDANLQAILEEEFERGQIDSNARDVFGVLMDAQNGDILAMAQSTRFDPNDLKTVRAKDMKNLVVESSFEPGSTLKPIVVAVALQLGVIEIDDVFDCEQGKLKIGRHTVHDISENGLLSASDVIMRSSNIGMSKIAAKIGSIQLRQSIEDLGFGRRTGISLPGESSGLLNKRFKWREIEAANVAFGQGISVSVLQLVKVYSAILNKGLMTTPRIFLDTPLKQRRVFDPDVADKVMESLFSVVNSPRGTGKNAKINRVEVYGKTGTAQKALESGRGYSDEVIASFIGAVDGKNLGLQRKLILFVAVDEPGVKPRGGGTLAAPIFQRAMDRVLSQLLTVKPSIPTSSI